MDSTNKKDRLLAVKLTEQLFSDKIGYDKYIMAFPDANDDDLLSELFDIIDNEAPEAAFGGESRLKQHNEMDRISELLKVLRTYNL